MKKGYFNYLLLIMLCLLLILITKDGNYLFGSTTDWINQHVPFFDYFRNLFWQTGNLFPNLALHLGAGTNIFAISYYGLYSPFLLLSYLLPGVSTVTYLQIMNIGSYITTVLLMYRFLLHKQFSEKISLLGAIFTLCASPLLFHFHRQFMFVDYFPFLILALFGVDRYFEKKKRDLLIISCFLMIMTSYYYSVAGIVTIVIYFLYELKKRYSWNSKIVKEKLIPFVLGIMISIFMSAILILPTAFALLEGRGELTNTTPLVLQFLPNISFFNLLYHNYNLGLPIIALVALLYFSFSKKKEESLLARILMIMLLFPIVSLILNGGLYARGKILLPLLPLVIFLIAHFLKSLEENSVSVPWKKISVILCVCLMSGFLFEFHKNNYWWLFLLDAFLIFYLIYELTHKKKVQGFFAFPIIIAYVLAIIANCQEEYVSISEYAGYDQQMMKEEIRYVLEKDSEFYRFNNLENRHNTINQIYGDHYYQTSIYSSLENSYYQNFVLHTMKLERPLENYFMLANTTNPVFLNYMNVKYLYTKNSVPIGYIPVDGTNNVYQNENTYPLAYGTNRLFPKDAFDLLDYPNTIATLLQTAVVENPTKNIFVPPNILLHDFSFKVLDTNLKIQEEEKRYQFEVKDKGTLKLQLSELIQNQILLLSFDVNNESHCGDTGRKITINGVTNQQSCSDWTYANQNNTFYYALSSNDEWNQLEIAFSEGNYEITNIKMHLLDYEIIQDYRNSITPFEIDKELTKGDVIAGSISLKEDGYFVTTIPFDQGYQVCVDGEKVEPEIVNTAFLGFSLQSGEHKIEIHYTAKGHFFGVVISAIGIILFAAIFYQENITRKRK